MPQSSQVLELSRVFSEKKSKTPRSKKTQAQPSVMKRPKKSNQGHECLLTDEDIQLFREGRHFRLYDKLGAHIMIKDGVQGVHFAVWAPNAASVSVVGDFNGWRQEKNPLGVRWDSSGIWEGFLPGVRKGDLYKYSITSKATGHTIEKRDPFAFYCELPPCTASIVWQLGYDWQDKRWMDTRHEHNALNKPFSVYELHIGSWRRKVESDNRWLSYRELADELVDYVVEMGFTHVELMPVTAYPFYGSWGYQPVGYFSPTSRHGDPQDLMYLIERLHAGGIGVIMDWVPSHFPADLHGLAQFDGTCLFEHEDPRQGFHPDWKSCIFNFGRNEVRSFLISSAMFWFEHYHIDGIRVDGVASMLYLDYSRNEGEWIPNHLGGRENLEAIDFVKQLNETVYHGFPDVQMIAEESTSWTGVSRPTYSGGLGFGMKWNMGWMHDTLEYFQKDAIHRKYHQNDLTFSMMYAFTENFMLSLSHDEVVHGKGSLLRRMPGDDWQKFANLRLMFAYMFAHPGKKLLFMGGEFAQWDEWCHERSLDWHLLQYDPHRGVQRIIKDLNHLYRGESALHECEFSQNGFEWIDFNDHQQSILSFVRKSSNGEKQVLAVCNFTPVPRHQYRVGVPHGGYWKEVFNSDAGYYGGSGMGNLGGQHADPIPYHGRPYSVSLTLPPLAVLYLKNVPTRSSILEKL